MYYLALIFRDDEGYGFTVPDVPGFTAHAAKASLDEAVAVARGVLADHLASLVDAGLAVPDARAPEQVIADPDVREGLGDAVATMLLPAVLPAGRTLRINISIDENMLALIDRAAGERKLTRSAFIAEAARRFATGEDEQPGARAAETRTDYRAGSRTKR